MTEKELIENLKLQYKTDDTEELYSKILQCMEDLRVLNIAVDNSVDSLHVADKNAKIVRVNKIFEQKTKISRCEIEGKSVMQAEEEGFYGPSIIPSVIKEKRKLTTIQVGPGGDAFVTANPVFDKNGDVEFVVSNARFLEELESLRGYYRDKKRFESTSPVSHRDVISESPIMQEILKTCETVAKTDSSVLFLGETGTGKSLIAKFLHDNSKRSSQKFVQINCAAIPDSLIESELFGYEGGSFTGARKGGKPGVFEQADKGTLFLDEIGDMPLNLQVKLLQALQNKEVTRLGGEKPVSVDVRIITATNKDLDEMMDNKEFRKDLYYRINVVPITVPPLRERREDIEALVNVFTERFNREHEKEVQIPEDVMESFYNYQWPGNIRELENLIERIIVTADKEVITVSSLPKPLIAVAHAFMDDVTVNRIIPLKDAIESVEEQLIQNAYKQYGSTYKVAKALKISQSGANRKIIKYTKE